MATSRELQEIARTAERMQRQIHNCHDVAQALIDTDQPWWREGIGGLMVPTDYQRARRSLREDLDAFIDYLNEMRSDRPNGEVIRLHSEVERVRECCRKCPKMNWHARIMDTSFECAAKGEEQNSNRSGLRFQLDSNGNIIQESTND